MVESVEQQIARAVADGSFAHQTAALPQQSEQIERLRTHLRRMAMEAQTDKGVRGDLGNGHPDVWGSRAAGPQRRTLEGIDGAGQVAQE